MGKRKDRRKTNDLYNIVVNSTADNRSRLDIDSHVEDEEIGDGVLANSKELSSLLTFQVGHTCERPHMKKFRFQLLHQAIIEQIRPCRVADIGGGKGLLAYLLQCSGWEATVIDPVWQALPDKYKDLATNRRVRIGVDERVPHINHAFEGGMAEEFDLLIAMHAHGCNIQVVDAAVKFGRSFLLLPCCIIDEPLYPLPGVHWLQCLVDYATLHGFAIYPFRLNFKGQNIGFYGRIPAADSMKPRS